MICAVSPRLYSIALAYVPSMIIGRLKCKTTVPTGIVTAGLEEYGSESHARNQ